MIEELKQRIEQLENQVSQLQNGLIDDSEFLYRGYVVSEKPDLPSTTYTTNTGFRRTVSLTGGAEDIIVPAYPYRFMKLKDYPNFYVPIHTFSQFAT